MELIVILFSLTFFLLKMMRLIKWDWIWVFAPMWMWGLILTAMIFYSSFGCDKSEAVDEMNFQSPASLV